MMSASGFAAAGAGLDQKIRNPDDWAAQAGDYANHRWSLDTGLAKWVRP